MLNDILHHVSAIAYHDYLVIVVSDFDGHDDTTRDYLLQISSRNDVICLLVYDPFLLDLPKSGELVVSGGTTQAELIFGKGPMRNSIDSFARNRGREFRSWQRELGLPMLPISAAEETAPQLRNLLEKSMWRQRRR